MTDVSRPVSPRPPEIEYRSTVATWSELGAVVERDQLDAETLLAWSFPLVSEAAELNWMRDLLDDHERMRADRFLFEKHRIRFTVAHAAMRLILGNLVGCDPAELVWKVEPLGKPSLVETQNPGNLEFNLSHSGDVGFLAVTIDHPIGADVEGVRKLNDAEALARVHFSDEEFERLSQGDLREQFFRYWTRKEALLKATGKGLSGGLRNFCTAGGDAERHGHVRACDASKVPLTDNWMFFDCPAPDSFLAAIVSNFVPTRIVCHQVQTK